jgi:hypothetical protein
VLTLAAANAVGVVLFGTLYAVAGAGVLPQPVFLVCLVVLFALMTGVWVRTESRHRGLDAVRRLGRIVLGLGIVVIATPVTVLGPMFWLDELLPAEAGLRAARGGIMALVLITLVVVLLMNVMGSLVAVGRAVLARRSPGKIQP